MAADRLIVSPPQPGDKAMWRSLYDGYAAFYKMPMNDRIADTLWGWLHDPAHVVEGLLARAPDGTAIGLAHFRAMPRPLAGATSGFLDDLYVAPAMRGGGVADALFDRLSAIGRERGWSSLRWLTADDNYRARAVYDRRARRTMWITYQMDL
jgi:GNAT superfamily N-acetyltransferase